MSTHLSPELAKLRQDLSAQLLDKLHAWRISPRQAPAGMDDEALVSATLDRYAEARAAIDAAMKGGEQ